jgi:hypothetical protein
MANHDNVPRRHYDPFVRCLTCGGPTLFARVRGNCRPCYQRYCDAVRAGKTTWEDLQRQGLLAPGGRVPRLYSMGIGVPMSARKQRATEGGEVEGGDAQA